MLCMYESSEGVKIIFNRAPEYRILRIGDLRNYSRPYKAVGKSIVFLQNSTVEHNIEISCMPAGNATEDKNFIINTFEKDCQKGKFGKLYIDNYYLYCNIYATDFEHESEVRGIFHIKCKLVSKWGWFNDIAYEFYGQRNAGLTSSQIRDLPFDFHQPNVTEYRLENRAILDSDIKIVFETANDSTVDSPSITIAGAAYRINATITPNYKIIIDPICRTITRINKTTGMEESVFRLRDTSSSVFAKVPSGIHKVTVAENVKATVTLLQERMTPLWT